MRGEAGPVRRSHERSDGEDGFTLVELLAVLAIVGMLFGIAFGISVYATRSARRAKAAAQIEEIADVLHDYLAENAALPAGLPEIAPRLPAGFSFDASTGGPLDPWKNPYVYQTNSAFSFALYSHGQSGTNSTPETRIVLGK